MTFRSDGDWLHALEGEEVAASIKVVPYEGGWYASDLIAHKRGAGLPLIREAIRRFPGKAYCHVDPDNFRVLRLFIRFGFRPQAIFLQKD